MNKKICQKCGATYEPYKVGKGEDVGTPWTANTNLKFPISGLCQFCNPKSKLYLS